MNSRRNAPLLTAEIPKSFTLPEVRIEVRHIPWKRLFDLFFSTLALTITAPLFLFLALLIKFSSKGKVFYAQRRIGRGGETFPCYKFRTMYADADERLKEILENDPSLKKEWEESHKLKNDPRVTKIGQFLRKSSLDELPQFWNVLRGDMSVVGPRAMVEEEIRVHVGDKAAEILSIRPGLTGLWQTSGRSDTSYPNRVYLDRKYVKEHSFWWDLKIIAKTLPVMLNSKGAY